MDLKKYMNKDLIEEKLYQVKDQFNQKKITLTKFHSILISFKTKYTHLMMEMVEHARYYLIMIIK